MVLSGVLLARVCSRIQRELPVIECTRHRASKFGLNKNNMPAAAVIALSFLLQGRIHFPTMPTLTRDSWRHRSRDETNPTLLPKQPQQPRNFCKQLCKYSTRRRRACYLLSCLGREGGGRLASTSTATATHSAASKQAGYMQHSRGSSGIFHTLPKT